MPEPPIHAACGTAHWSRQPCPSGRSDRAVAGLSLRPKHDALAAALAKIEVLQARIDALQAEIASRKVTNTVTVTGAASRKPVTSRKVGRPPKPGALTAAERQRLRRDRLKLAQA